MQAGVLRRTATIVALIFGMSVLAIVSAHAQSGQIDLEVPNGTGVQFGFDVDGATLTPVTAASTDVRTNTSTTFGYRQLVAMNDAGVVRLGAVDFAGVGCDTLRAALYVPSIVTGASSSVDPEPGTVYAVRSRLGMYAKLQLVALDTAPPAGLILNFVTDPCPPDVTPPEITSHVSGDAGQAGWFIGPVDISWTVTDPETPPVASGCDPVTLTHDTTAETVTCSATSVGGTNAESVTVAIDQTPPLVTYTGNQGTYDIDEHVAISCSSSDETSGIDWDTCSSVDAPASSFATGPHTMSATAADVAGHESSSSTTFTVVVTPSGMTRLILQLVSDGALSSQLTHKIDVIARAPNADAKAGAVGAFRNLLAAKTGKGISAENASLLSSLAGAL